MAADETEVKSAMKKIDSLILARDLRTVHSIITMANVLESEIYCTGSGPFIPATPLR